MSAEPIKPNLVSDDANVINLKLQDLYRNMVKVKVSEFEPYSTVVASSIKLIIG